MSEMVDKKTTDQLVELSEILSGEAKLKKDNYSAQRRKTRADSTSKITKYKSKKLNKNTDDDISPKAKNQKSFHNTMKATSKKKKSKSTQEQSPKTKKHKYFEVDNQKYERIQKALREKNKKEDQITSEEIADDVITSKIVQLKNLYTWESPMRIQIQFEKKSFIIVIALSLIFILYLTILGKYFLMLAVIAILFVIYVASVTPTTNVKHSITTRGIFSIDKLYEWFMLDEYWFSKKGETIFMIVKTKLRFPTSLIILVKESQIDDIFKTLVYRLPYRINNKYVLGEKLSFGEIISSEKFQKFVDDDVDIKSKS